ncbi:Similar to RpS4: 40S ribosomal protein S4 (Lysiphlebus testaceipes) [Cotesia congregata]|uniref:Small ribosomal subunit protein eS4 n=1 Tax=Cotesia congregata TaxID=51543 RepID=A0A8J2MB38_COTCN|nr:Similar to RpS4: 40S ribosomal protein S4 (Lysiphlebus testaceipes) [Cotesia congregata]
MIFLLLKEWDGVDDILKKIVPMTYQAYLVLVQSIFATGEQNTQHYRYPHLSALSLKTGEYFRLIYDVKGRFAVHRITAEEAKYKLCKVRKVQTGPKGIPFLVTHDGRTIRYPDPVIKVNDTIQLEIASSKILDSIRFEPGNLCMITGGRNLGRVGTVVNRERHPGSFDICHIKDAQGHTFATRLNNVFIIGKGTKAYISLPRGKGIKLSIAEERDKRLAAKGGN